MSDTEERTLHSRRSLVKLAGASTATVLLAGCGGPGGDDENVDQDDGQAQGEGETNENTTGDQLAPSDDEVDETNDDSPENASTGE